MSIGDNLQPFATGQDEVEVTAHVIREGIIRDGLYGGKQESVDLQSEQLRLGDRVLNTRPAFGFLSTPRQAKRRTRRIAEVTRRCASTPTDSGYTCSAKLRLPRNYRNPGAMDLVGYLAEQGIRLTGSAHGADVEILPGFAGSRVGLWRSRVSRSALAQIAQLWPGERGALMQAALIGGRAFFGR